MRSWSKCGAGAGGMGVTHQTSVGLCSALPTQGLVQEAHCLSESPSLGRGVHSAPVLSAVQWACPGARPSLGVEVKVLVCSLLGPQTCLQLRGRLTLVNSLYM